MPPLAASGIHSAGDREGKGSIAHVPAREESRGAARSSVPIVDGWRYRPGIGGFKVVQRNNRRRSGVRRPSRPILRALDVIERLCRGRIIRIRLSKISELFSINLDQPEGSNIRLVPRNRADRVAQRDARRAGSRADRIRQILCGWCRQTILLAHLSIPRAAQTRESARSPPGSFRRSMRL